MNASIFPLKNMLGALGLFGALFSAAHGQVPLKVGQAEVIRNEVVSVGEAELVRVSVGDQVVRDETLRTSDDSHARIRLLDDTKLSLGPRSTIKIDRAVYSGETSYREITVKLSEGAFRFITGKSDKKSYKIETPLASPCRMARPASVPAANVPSFCSAAILRLFHATAAASFGSSATLSHPGHLLRCVREMLRCARRCRRCGRRAFLPCPRPRAASRRSPASVRMDSRCAAAYAISPGPPLRMPCRLAACRNTTCCRQRRWMFRATIWNWARPASALFPQRQASPGCSCPG